MYTDFKTEMKESIIPHVEEMIRKEEKHLSFLKNHALYAEASFISKSEQVLKHLYFRLQQYKEYVDENTKEA